MGFSEIQIGIDLATSATIIFSGLAFWSQYLRATKAARRSDKIEKTRAVALSRVYEISREFEDAYMNLLDVHRDINRRVYGTPYGVLMRHTPNGDQPKTLSDYEELMAGFQNFAYLVFKRRYTLLPLLEVIDEEVVAVDAGASSDNAGNQSKSTVWSDVTRLKNAEIHLGLAYEYFVQLSRLKSLVMAERNYMEGASESADAAAEYLYQNHEEIKRLSVALLTDGNFQSFIREIYIKLELPKEDSKTMARYLHSPSSVAAFPETLATCEGILARAAQMLLVELLKGDRAPLFSRAERTFTERLDESTLICKEILIKISALLSKTLHNSRDQSFNDIVERYEGERYLVKNRIHG